MWIDSYMVKFENIRCTTKTAHTFCLPTAISPCSFLYILPLDFVLLPLQLSCLQFHTSCPLSCASTPGSSSQWRQAHWWQKIFLHVKTCLFMCVGWNMCVCLFMLFKATWWCKDRYHSFARAVSPLESPAAGLLLRACHAPRPFFQVVIQQSSNNTL